MDLYIAEKPELARAIKDAINGAESVAKGYYTKGNTIITYAIGHLLELKKPEEMDERYKVWSFENLPFNFQKYEYKPIDSTKSQLKIVCDLIKDKRVSRIIHCGDADDEGQILIEEILNYAKNTKPVMRVLINDLTQEAITKEIANMQPNSNFKTMSDRGFSRSIADWETGLNLTRAYTCAYRQKGGEGLISVGRVMTPILGLIVTRDYENANFKSLDYFAIKANFTLESAEFLAKLELAKEEKITDESKANSIKQECENQNFSFEVKSEEKKEFPPLPFNLLKLQTKASALYGFSANKTLEITQKLRETHKAITYNRSDCEYLPSSAFENANEILTAVAKNITLNTSKADLSYKGRAFNDSKLSAHYGIIPTKSTFDKSKLSDDELKIYTLISERFLMQFFKPCEYISYSLKFSKGENIFKTNLRKNIKLGFKEFFSGEEEGEEETNLDLMNLNGKSALCKEILISKEKTKPKPLYTMTSLLKDLNSVAKYVKNEKIKKLLLEKDKDKKGESGGIGTPATRSAMIEKLIKQEYIEVSKDKKQTIKSTPKGQNLIKCCSGLLSTPDMTALWYEYQKEIEAGNRAKENFLISVKNEIAQEINRLKGGDFTIQIDQKNKKESFVCPKCNSALIRREARNKKGYFFWGCSNYQNCDIGFISDDKGKPNFNNTPKEIDKTYQCPKCNSGFLQKRKSMNKAGKEYFWYGCSEWKNGCDFRCFDNNGKPKVE